MATKSQKSAPTTSSKTKGTRITRVSASDNRPTKKVTKAVVAKKPAKKTKASVTKTPARGLKPLYAIGGYFKGAWIELKQVRWPNRRATWSLTGAVLLFTTFFVVLVVLLDVLFKFLFEIILK